MNAAVGVCGFPRCGSSMMMAMLDAGGIPPVEGSSDRGYELSSLANLPKFSMAFLADRAIKLLDAALWSDPWTWPLMDWRFVWLDRDHTAQATSMVKFLGPSGLDMLPLTETDIPVLRDSFGADRKTIVPALKARGRLLIVSYADVLRRPRKQAERLATFLAPTFTLDAVSAANVVHRRGPECLPHIAEFAEGDPT